MKFLESASQRLLFLLLRKLVLCLLSYLAPVMAVLLLFFFIYSFLFLIPKYIAEDVKAEGNDLYGLAVAIFTTGDRDDWKLSDDRELYEKYKEMDLNWLEQFMDQEDLDNSRVDHYEGNAAGEDITVKEIWGRFYEKDSGIPAERPQARQHSVSWALLAAVDRVLGDPVITGLPGRRPDPAGHFGKLAPNLKWQDFELYYKCSWTEKNGAGASVKKHTRIYRHSIKLLAEVHSYEAEKITFQWEARRYFYKDPGSDYVEEAVFPVFVSSEQQGPYFEKLRSLLADNQLFKASDTELVINLAMNYDEEFKYNISLLSGNITELYFDTEKTDYRQAFQPGRYQWPTAEYATVASGFGWRIHPVLGGLRFHKGIDIAVPAGTRVLSAWDGKVVLAGRVEGYGNMVMIDHGRYRTLYAHLMSCDVEPGREVRRGDQIGRADSTGLSTGDHLHFEIRSGAGQTDYHDPLALYQSLSGGEGAVN